MLTMAEILLVIGSLNNKQGDLCRLYLACNINLDVESSCQHFNPAPASLVALFIGFIDSVLGKRIDAPEFPPRLLTTRGAESTCDAAP